MELWRSESASIAVQVQVCAPLGQLPAAAAVLERRLQRPHKWRSASASQRIMPARTSPALAVPSAVCKLPLRAWPCSRTRIAHCAIASDVTSPKAAGTCVRYRDKSCLDRRLAVTHLSSIVRWSGIDALVAKMQFTSASDAAIVGIYYGPSAICLGLPGGSLSREGSNRAYQLDVACVAASCARATSTSFDVLIKNVQGSGYSAHACPAGSYVQLGTVDGFPAGVRPSSGSLCALRCTRLPCARPLCCGCVQLDVADGFPAGVHLPDSLLTFLLCGAHHCAARLRCAGWHACCKLPA
jgi:hypothetical protein